MATVYCTCRTTVSTGFMIQCDRCEEWFHGDCIKMTQTEGKKIENYYCRACQEKDPTLQITRKPAPPRRSTDTKKSSKKSSGKKDGSRKLSSPSPSNSSASNRKSGEKSQLTQDKSSSSPESAGEEDEDWNASEGASRRSRPSESVDGAGVKKGSKSGSRKTSGGGSTGKKPTPAKKQSSKTGQPQRAAYGETNMPVGGRAPGYLNNREVENLLGIPPPLPVPPEPRNAAAGATTHEAGHDVKKPTSRSPRKGGRGNGHLGNGILALELYSDDEKEYPGFDRNNLTQCMGPKCCYAAAPNSKYCSEECGRALARKRLMTFMPTRLEQQGNSSYAATVRNQKDMDGIRKKLADCKAVLEKLAVRKMELEETILKGKAEKAVEGVEEDDEVEYTCITCGHAVNKGAIKHFERCFNRFENQTSYGSAFITATSSNIFCDTLNPKTHTYCKRLKVLCPEHLKETVDDNEVCGFPLNDDCFRPTHAFCQYFKKNCFKHPSWERIKRAEIDLETLRTWIKMDELVEQERTIMMAIQSRGGIIQNMTNYTIHRKEPTISPTTGLSKPIVKVLEQKRTN